MYPEIVAWELDLVCVYVCMCPYMLMCVCMYVCKCECVLLEWNWGPLNPPEFSTIVEQSKCFRTYLVYLY